MHLVQVLSHDHWVKKDVFELVAGDVWQLNSQNYLVTGAAYLENGRQIVPCELIEDNEVRLRFDSREKYIHMAMDYVGSSATAFDDDTMMICDLSGETTNIYSPRLPMEELNSFCKRHLNKYEAFFTRHQNKIKNGQSIAMAKFW